MATFSDLFTHTRASTATYTDANGILQTAAINEPRTNSHYWNGSAWVKGYQHESEARTNLITYSSDFTNAAWTKLAVSVASGQVSPDGTTNANLVTNDGTSSQHYTVTSPGVDITNAHTFSVFLKAGTANYAHILLTTINAWIQIDLSDGSIMSSGVLPVGQLVDFGVQQFGGFYRVHLAASGAGYIPQCRVYFLDAPQATAGPVETSSSTGIVYGAQFELGSTPSSYIPTAGATVTRAADVMTLPIANIPYPTGSPLAVSIAMDGVMTYADNNSGSTVEYCSWFNSSTDNLQYRLTTVGALSGSVFIKQKANNIEDFVQSADIYSPGVNVPFSIASRHGSTFINGAVDGTALTADLTPVAFPNLSATNMSIAPTFNGFIHKFRMWGDTTGDIGDIGIAEASAT